MPLERQVLTLGKSKKIVLFIVEGSTDETSLSLILSKLIEEDKKVKFKVIRNDITTEGNVSSTNIINKITEKVNEFIKSDIYTKKDIVKIVHIVDTDGAFINECFIQHKKCKIHYTTEKIEVDNVEFIKNQHKKKSDILSRLATTTSVYKGIPYVIYFFSCNLEHVLHNKQNVPQDEKEYYAYKFTEKFSKNPEDFVNFINDPIFAISKGYKESWDFIKMGTNSLQRYSNFHIYINDIKK